MTMMVTTDRYRSKCVFLSPDDYDVSLADVVAPEGATGMLDGKTINTPFRSISRGLRAYTSTSIRAG
jgi:hypothetical protein